MTSAAILGTARRTPIMHLTFHNILTRSAKWFLKIIAEGTIQYYVALLLSGGVVLASPAILHSRALTIWQHLTHTFPTEWTLADVILIVAALVFLLSLARVFKRRRETGRIPRKDVDKPFEERLGVAWKYDPNNGIPEYVPYCPMHHIKLVIRSYAPPRKMYQCVIDKQNWWFGDWEVNNAYEEVSIICQAKVDGSYRK